MGYHHADIAEIDPTPGRPSVQRSISDAVGLENAAINRYEVEPGEEIPLVAGAPAVDDVHPYEDV